MAADGISIPHRYDKNSSFRCLRLLGNYQISIPHRYDKNRLGRFWKSVWRDEIFQFLIGTIKTSDSKNQHFRLLSISIPHRYDKNCIFCLEQLRLSCISIPHRYDKNTPCNISNYLAHRFQFLIGTIKTWYISHSESLEWKIISIPHRYDKNCNKHWYVKVKTRISIPHRYDKN